MKKFTLAALGLALVLGTLGVTAIPASAAAPNGRYRIMHTFKLHKKIGKIKAIPLRRGYYDRSKDRGSGWTKIRIKHNITDYRAVRAVTKSPNRSHQGGDRWRANAWAYKIVCRPGGCQVTKRVHVRQVFALGKVGTGKRARPFGVVTQFCLGYSGKCPSWVTIALVNLDKKRSAPAMRTGTAYAASYRWQ
jgi:hypothetical protein